MLSQTVRPTALYVCMYLTHPYCMYFDIICYYSALGQVMLYVDGMNGVISHPQTLHWLYTLTSSKVSIHH